MFNALRAADKAGTDSKGPEIDMGRDRLYEIGVAMALLTRLPLPRLPEAAFARQAASAWAWPLAGFVVAALAALVGIGALALGLPATMAALLVLGVQMVTTGAMHEDGLADTADGLWGGWTRERRLEIMKDSQIGTYGVLALIVVTGLRWSILSALLTAGPGALLAIAVLSRAPMAVLMTALPNARGDGLSKQVGVPTPLAVSGGVLLALVLSLIFVGWPTLIAAGVVAVGTALLGWIAMRKIGGQTGDILGASQQVGEALAGVVFVLLLV